MTTLKLNWGAKIAILYGGFVILIVTLVTMSMKQDFQLVSPDYYQKEIRYQEVIDAGRNQSSLSAPALLHAGEKTVTIDMPSEFTGKVVKGNVEFYAAANSRWDAVFELQTEHNRMVISRAKLRPTNYKVKISWEAEGRKYYQESSINLYQ